MALRTVDHEAVSQPWYTPPTQASTQLSHYRPTPIPFSDAFSQSSKPSLFSPALTVTKLQAPESLLAPVFDNSHHHHHNIFPSLPPGPSLPLRHTSRRRHTRDFTPTLEEESVSRMLKESYTSRGIPESWSQGCTTSKITAVNTLRDQYQASMLETFKMIGNTARKNQALQEDTKEALKAAAAHQIQNESLASQHAELLAINAAIGEHVVATNTECATNPHAMAETNHTLKAQLMERKAALVAEIRRAELAGEEVLDEMLAARQIQNIKPQQMWNRAKAQHVPRAQMWAPVKLGSRPYCASLVSKQ